MSLCMSMREHVRVSAGAHRGQRHHMFLELEFQAVVNHLTWVLGTAFGSFARAVHAFNC